MRYLDIETVSAYPSFTEADERTQALFEKKMAHDQRYLELLSGTTGNVALNTLYTEKAALFAEFNKIVCVSMGEVLESGEIYIKSFSGHDEQKLLADVLHVLKNTYWLAAHYGKGFDFPVLSRKFVIYRMPLPMILDNAGKKPWEINLVDTADLWKFGDMKHSASLDLLAHCFGLPSPKEGISGADVTPVYWKEGDEGLKKIAHYCEGDVRTLINVHRIIGGQDPIM